MTTVYVFTSRIGGVTFAGVLDRAEEIGLRRALGATRRQVASQFIVESMLSGLIGGLVGSSFGIGVVVFVAQTRGWTPAADFTLPLLGPSIGVAVGVAAGLYPAWRAASLQPTTALRR